IGLVTDQGDEVLLDLSTAIAMADRDGVQLDDGTWFIVLAAAEPVVDVAHSERHQLVRIAWHLGNRHVPTEVRGDALRIRPDHVIEDMLRGLGATVVKLKAPFQPEGGAYSDHHGVPHSSSDHDGGLLTRMRLTTVADPVAKLAFANIPDRLLQLFAWSRVGDRVKPGP